MTNQTEIVKKFNDVLAKLETLDSMKKDVMITKNDIHINDETGLITVSDVGSVGFTHTGFTQFCNRFGMSARYAEKCIKRDPKMFAQHMKVWVNDYQDEKEMLFRTYQKEGEKTRIRAVLSDRYGIMDNYPTIKEVSKIADTYNIDVSNFGLSSDFADLRITFPEQKRVIGKLNDGKTDDYIFPGIHIRNSETGLSKLVVSFVVYRLVCTNGMVAQRGNTQVVSKKHMGEIRINVISQVEQLIKAIPTIFAQYADAMLEAKSIHYMDVNKILKTIVDRYGLTKEQIQRVEKGFAEEPGKTKHHVLQAITAAGRNTKDWSERIQLENLAERFLLDRVA